MLDGNRVADDQTPEGLGLEDGDVRQDIYAVLTKLKGFLFS